LPGSNEGDEAAMQELRQERRRLVGTASAAAAVLGLVLAGSASSSGAQTPTRPGVTCAQDEVSAKGEPASYRWLALLKARGNWRGKVRAMPRLGAAYATVGIAHNPTERCIFNTGSVVCSVIATPCRR
jgi:hypothetical protein